MVHVRLRLKMIVIFHPQEGVSGEWRGAWLMLVRRLLLYYTDTDGMKTVDLRKTRCVGEFKL